MEKYPISLVPVVASLLLAAGCGGPPAGPAVVEVPGYQALQEQFTGIDKSPLAGRRIVLDPGHGGFFRGAVGLGGLTEAEVNLGVALYLRGLLEWADAEVFMTRTADYDFLTENDSTLVRDLAFRHSFTDSLQPDVFLSLHHNSVASLDRTVNETQTYFPLGDDGASLDLARAIHRHLVLNLEITPAKILPGNFHVLRNVTVPAVLGEPAMISNPVMEGRLTMAASQRLEAEAYFLGLLDYFAQGCPTWSGAGTDTVIFNPDHPSALVSWTFLSEARPDNQGPGPDPGTFDLTLDGRRVPFHFSGSGRTVSWCPSDPDPDLPAVLELRGRNLKGRAAPVRRTLLKRPPPGLVKILLMPESPDSNQHSGVTAVRWSVTDSTPLPAGRLVFSPDLALPIDEGTSGAALLPSPAEIPSEAWYQPDSASHPNLPCEIKTVALPDPWRWRLMSGSPQDQERPWSMRDLPPCGLPVGVTEQKVPLIPYRSGHRVWVTAPGVKPLVDPDPASRAAVRTIFAGDREWPAEPLVPFLEGKVIVLDPAGGGSDPDGAGPLGTRGATLNLETALLAADLLEGCGARVHLTRRGETALPAEDKVRLAGKVGADFFLTIGRHARPHHLAVRYHPGSEAGRRWARLFQLSVAPLAAADDSLAMTTSYDYLLRHTACPALEVRLSGPWSAWREMQIVQRGWQRAEARAVLLSLASLGQTDGGLAPVLDLARIIGKLPGAPDPDSVDWAELDGNLLWSPVRDRENAAPTADLSPGQREPLDSSSPVGLPALPGRHTLEIRAGSVQQMWLLEGSNEGYSARLMINNP